MMQEIFWEFFFAAQRSSLDIFFGWIWNFFLRLSEKILTATSAKPSLLQPLTLHLFHDNLRTGP